MLSKEFDYLPKKFIDVSLHHFNYSPEDMYTYYMNWTRRSDKTLRERIRFIKSAILVAKEIKRTKGQVQYNE